MGVRTPSIHNITINIFEIVWQNHGMKKLLALLLLSPLVVSEDEFPIELTCEIGASIVYFNLEIRDEGSWWTPHDSHEFMGKLASAISPPIFNNKKFKDKKNKNFGNYNITDGQIIFQLKSTNVKPMVRINRYSLRISVGSQYHQTDGQCYIGFKEYTKKQI